MQTKRYLFYLIIFFLCIAGYFVSKHIVQQQTVQYPINYKAADASEVYMAWGLIGKPLPSKENWPDSSKLEQGMVFTKLKLINNSFTTQMQLHNGDEIYYWMVKTKDVIGNSIEVWDSGGDHKVYFSASIRNNSLFRPGYFIFLAGFLPLLLFMKKHHRQPFKVIHHDNFNTKGYIPGLDSLRAIAVLLVIIHHWVDEKSWLNFLPNGQIGVNVFFVLSGFLITSILLNSKNQIDDGRIAKGTVFKNFYIRRTLRIFPIYYLVLIIFWFANNPAVKEQGIYYFTYTTNILFFNEQFFPGRLAHLWSLAVEEQFYIFWPWLIVLVNKKWLPFILGLFLVIGISTNYIITDRGWWVQIFTPACFDAFAIGGFLSYLSVYRHDIISKMQRSFRWVFLISLVIFLQDVFHLNLLPNRTTQAVFAFSIIFYCVYKNNNRVANLIFNNKWLQSLGKISYGIYLYHLFIPELWDNVILFFKEKNIDLFFNEALPDALKPAWLFIQYFLLLLIISQLSWKLIEKPINGLKSKFTNKERVNKKLEVAAL